MFETIYTSFKHTQLCLFIQMYSIIFLSLVLSVLSTTSCYVKDEAKKCIKDGSGEAKCKDDVKITKEDAMALCEDAFQDNMDITSFVFEGTDKLVIGKNAFKGATKLVSFTANSGIQSLGTSAFEGDVALTKIDLTGLAEIPESAFKGCSKLADVTGTENVATVQKDAFNGCVKLLSVNFYAPLTKLLDSLASQNNLFFHGTVQPTTLPDPTTPINNKLKVFVTDSYTAGTFGGLIALKANCTTLQCVDISTKIPDENPPQPAAKTEKALKCVDCDSKKMSVDGNNYYCEIDMTECIKTHTDCRICTKEKCQKCVISKYLEEDTCKQTCSDGYYKDTTEFMCNKCKDEKCKTCGADLECIECKDNHFLIEDTKKCTTDSTCPAGYYKEETAKKCVKCGSNCKVCTKDACTSCTTDSYYVDRNECKACSESITNCGKCTSQKECTKCSKGNLIKDKTKCVDTCPDKFYSANKVCTECEQSCKRCVEAGKCTECPDNDILLLDTGKCQSGTECPNGYSKDTTGKKCIKCIHFL
ncbi:hypothetical protein EIN_476870 [Entamoeba invadens IP1]|uniref:Uncharacterized protein n=1 Tax=Entamoeba invadens IP1 TaxID=370355 RepID=A0A0A1UG42_ENTIV|nr:hypothetical protein EIN_476870 [Entamoeba invadens IP1]ELP94391.1 hypothetical protein EIN_476870 [Entamoeba invadens IP1]|eukprot:XP_004261162.1 hypothetical protein EIN_476870 [Entamoeba invadens IP1]